MAEDVSDALRKALPATSESVDRYRSMAVWDQAIVESLAVFADARKPLPADVRELVQDLLDQPAINSKFRKRCRYHLEHIPF